MKKFTSFIKFIPLIIVGIAVIVWGTLFQRGEKKEGAGTVPADDAEGSQAVFPY